jgi:hypothetical protein
MRKINALAILALLGLVLALAAVGCGQKKEEVAPPAEMPTTTETTPAPVVDTTMGGGTDTTMAH